MKKILLMAISVVLSAAVFAQNAPAAKPAKKANTAVRKSVSPEERAQKKVERMKADLKISDDQAAKIKEIYLTEDREFEAAKAKTYPSKAEKMKAYKEIKEKAKDGYNKVLTADQQALEKKLWEERRTKKGEKKAK